MRPRAFATRLTGAALVVLSGGGLGLAGSIREAAAQTPAVPRAVVASGGGVSANGTVMVIGTIGQPVIGATGGSGSPRADFGLWASAAAALAAPQITDVSPSSGPMTGGTTVTLTGVGFSSDATVTVDGVAAPLVSVASTMQTIVLVAPPHAPGRVPITVTTAGGSTTIPDAYSYLAPAPNETDDGDGDGLADACELRFGLDALRFTDPNADPDGDGKTNLQECQAGTHPRGFYKLYFAEGAANGFFLMDLALLNPTVQLASVVEEFYDPAGTLTTHPLFVSARSRATTGVNALFIPHSTFSTVIESDIPIVAERSMTWDATGRYGNHSGRGVTQPASTWFFAEGATAGPFDLFYLIVNPGDTPTDVTLTYLRSSGQPPIVKRHTLPAHSRTTIKVDDEDAQLAEAEIAARIDATAPIVVERAMYANTGGQSFNAGAVSPGLAAPRTAWYFAEGATGFFDLYLLLANPDSAADAVVDVTYLLPDGTNLIARHDVPAGQRVSIAVANEDPALRATTPSIIVSSANSVPVLAERSMWWPSGYVWYEGHIVSGSPDTGVLWALADAQAGTSGSASSYVLILNQSTHAGTATVTLLFDNGPPASVTVNLPAQARTTLSVADLFPAAAGRAFGVLVESTGATPAQIVVERATYWDALGLFWSAGDAQLATRLR